MVKVKVKYCGYGYIEESANDLLERMKANEKYVDVRVMQLSDILALVMLIYEIEV